VQGCGGLHMLPSKCSSDCNPREMLQLYADKGAFEEVGGVGGGSGGGAQHHCSSPQDLIRGKFIVYCSTRSWNTPHHHSGTNVRTHSLDNGRVVNSRLKSNEVITKFRFILSPPPLPSS
jgi:hypothetical protein